MIRMVQSTSASHAKAYFDQALAQADYYIDEQELAGRFEGKLSKRLGLDEKANREAFHALAENVDPTTSDPLTPRTKEERTVGYDINFHCPKSLSVLHVLSKDDHILKAFESSVSETMKEVERDAKTRVRKDNQYFDRETQELCWASFTHQTARPVEDAAPDPHLHAHCFVFNATWDGEEKAIKAGQFRDIKRDMPYYQARFHKRLSDKMIALGYGIRRTDKSFEIEGVPQQVIDLFSKRTDEIGRVAKEKGITDAKTLDELGARTRSKKQKGRSMADLRADWKRQIEGLNLGDAEGAAPVRFVRAKERQAITEDECVSHAIGHSFERASVVQDRRILASAYRHGIGDDGISLDAITDRFKAEDSIIRVNEDGKQLCTTRLVLAEEKQMVELARRSQSKMRPLYTEVPDIEGLDDGQKAAVEHVLSTSHRISIVRGAAGAGKTTLMREASRLIDRSGKSMTVAAPTTQAVGVLKAEGFHSASTVAQLLLDRKLQESVKGQVLWVDEAGLLGNRDMIALLKIAEKQNARLVLGGDTRQHASVIRGDALRILNKVAGIRSAEVAKIYRQRQELYRAVVEDLSKGDVAKAFEKLETAGSIRQIDPMKPADQLSEDYVTAVKKGKSCLIVSPTNAHAEAVTEVVRKRLRAAGLLGKKEIEARSYRNHNLTEAEKQDWRNYRAGLKVQFNQNVGRIRRGSIWKVESAGEKEVLARNSEGDLIAVPMHRANEFDVLSESKISLSKGDKVRMTRTVFDKNEKRLNNGTMLEVLKVSKSGKLIVKVADGKATFKLDTDVGHIAHAHCVTSHASQGKTVDEVFIAQSAATFPATDAKQLYVSVSRGRDAVHIYTDDAKELLSHARREGDRQSAIELVGWKGRTQKEAERFVRLEPQPEPIAKQYQNEVNTITRKPGRDYEPEI